MDVDRTDDNRDENESVSRKNRIKVYKNILNYYKGRSLSLDSILASKQPSIDLPSEINIDDLRRSIHGLHDDIILIESIRNSLKLINHSLTCTELMRVNEINFRGNILNKIEGILYFSKSIMKLYNECVSEIEIIEKMKNYSQVLNDYMKRLDKLREEEKLRDEHSKEMEKIERQVYKINLMRTMKSILIGYISLNCPNLLRSVQSFMSPLRRDLSVDDFSETWNIGLSTSRFGSEKC